MGKKWVTSGYQPGDLIIMDFDGGGPDHIGICEAVRPDGSIDTIEGNTGITNDANGGQVMRRPRKPSQILGACRPDYAANGVDKLFAVARKEINVTEYPPGSNNVKYNTDYYGKAVTGTAYPWCVVFIWWCFKQAGMSSLFYGGNKTASCTVLAKYYGYTGENGNKPAAPPPPDITVAMKLLRKGNTGTQVKVLQYLLSVMGYAVGTIDGDFGNKTDAAVKLFQTSKRLTADGIVGKNTWAALLA